MRVLRVCAVAKAGSVAHALTGRLYFTGGGGAHVTNPQRPKDAAERPLLRKGRLISVCICTHFYIQVNTTDDDASG